MADMENYFCEKCKRTKRRTEFYKSNNLEKYPDGVIPKCKDCLTLHVDNWEPETFLWILQECDVPYIPEEWDKLLKTYGKDRSKVTGKTIIGRYIGKMRLKQYKDWRWKDTEYLQQLSDNKTIQAMKRAGYGMAEIDQVITERRSTLPNGDVEIPVYKDEEEQQKPAEQEFTVGSVADLYDNSSDDDLENDLTDEDRKYLRLKWGKAYRPAEWISLEQLYNEMYQSFDIQGAAHEDTLKMVCKTSLKANQLLDMGDVDGAQKMVKMYDQLMKSGKFTAAQNKAESGEVIDSIAELVEMCEKMGYIERFYVETPNDKVDLTLKDMQRYTASLIEGETNLSTMVEAAIKQNLKDDEDSKNNTETEIVDDDNLFDDLEKQLLTDKDFEDFYDSEEEDAEYDLSLFEEDDI